MVQAGSYSIVAVTSGRNVPSARFRVRQYLPVLHAQGIRVKESIAPWDVYFPGKSAARSVSGSLYRGFRGGIVSVGRLWSVLQSWTGSATWLERSLVPGVYTWEPLLRRPLILDIDDAIWLYRPTGRSSLIRTVSNASLILAGNRYLAEWVRAHAEVRQIEIVPTAIDCNRFRPATSHGRRDGYRRLVIGWTGSASNLGYLKAIERPLGRFLRDHEDCELLVISDAPPDLAGVPRVRYRTWSPAIEAEAVRAMDVGLMPLPDDEWTRGKCSFKMLQYMATGIPCLVSPVGMNAEILAKGRVGLAAVSEDDWYEGLRQLRGDPESRGRMGTEARRLAEAEFSVEIVGRRLASFMRKVLYEP